MEIKTFPFAELKVAGDGAGTFEGRASSFGTIDSYGDRIAPGAYKDTIPQFLERGFIGWGHNWADPIGMVMGAEERDDGLHITGQFHGDTDAQKYRQRVKERLAADKFMGLSIGFQAEDYHFEEEGSVRVLDKIKLFEVSLVSVPAERNSQVMAVKGFGIEFDEHTSQLRVALGEWVARCKAGSAERVKDGKGISEERRSLMEAVSGSLRSHVDEIDALLVEPEPSEPSTPELAPAAEGVDPALVEMREQFYSIRSFYERLEEGTA